MVCSAFPPQIPAQDGGVFRIGATPVRYSPILSSTPGIRLSLNSSRMPLATAEYLWNASYGTFLSWNPPDYAVRLLGPEVVNRGEMLYWTYSEPPGPAQGPVHITVTARNPLTQAVTGSAALTLEWDGGTAVVAGDSY